MNLGLQIRDGIRECGINVFMSRASERDGVVLATMVLEGEPYGFWGGEGLKGDAAVSDIVAKAVAQGRLLRAARN